MSSYTVTQQILGNQKGLSMVEVVMAMGIFGLVSVGISMQFNLAAQAVNRTKKLQESISIDREINNLLQDRNHCLESLRGIEVQANEDSKKTAVESLYYAVPDPAVPGTYRKSDAPLIAVNQNHGDLVIDQISFNVVNKLGESPDRFLVELYYEARDPASSHIIGSAPARFVLETDGGGAVRDCYSSLDTSLALNERLCEIEGGGDYYYDSATGECESRYVESWYDGDNGSASCPAGWEPSWGAWSCGAYATADWEDEYATIDRAYDGGYTDEARPEPYVTDFTDSSGTCHCYYASDLPVEIKSLFKCEIYCRQL